MGTVKSWIDQTVYRHVAKESKVDFFKEIRKNIKAADSTEQSKFDENTC